MKRIRPFLRRQLCILPVLLITLLSFRCPALELSAEQDSTLQLPGVAPPERHDPWSDQQRREMEKKQNVKREQDIKRDTDKLLELSTELKQYVDRTNENIISMDVIKKAEQIEKLAKNIREKMKGMN
jgi:hypothetical protein